MDEKRQVQKELFEEFVKDDRRKHPKGKFLPGPKRIITLSSEHLIFIVMAFIITAAVFFSLGVERGKRLEAKSRSSAGKVKEQAPVRIAAAPEQIQKEAAAEEKAPPAKTRERPKKEEHISLYTVQVASYFTKDAAEREAQRLKEKGFKPFVLSSGKYYIACVGEFENKAKAASEQKKLRKLYPDCLLREK